MHSSPAPAHLFHQFTCAHCSQSILAPVSCGNRFCPICQASRRRRVLSKMRACLSAQDPVSGYRFRHLILTVKNGSDAKERASLLLHSFRKLRQSRLWKEKCLGGCFVLEATGGVGNWHIHLHAIVFTRWMRYNSLQRAWKKASGATGCFIKTVPPKVAAQYLTKYLTKFDITISDQFALSKSLKGVRLFNVFGSWFKLLQSIPKIKYCCQYCGYSCFYFDSGASSGRDEIRRQQARARDPDVFGAVYVPLRR